MIARSFGIPWGLFENKDVETGLSFSGSVLDKTTEIPWEGFENKDVSTEIVWGDSQLINLATVIPWGALQINDSSTEIRWGDLQPYNISCVIPWGDYLALNVSDFRGDWTVPDVRTKRTRKWTLRWYNTPGFMMIVQNVTVIRTSDSTPIQIMGCTIDISMENAYTNIKMDLPIKSEAEKVHPVSGPVDVTVTINGYPFRFLIEKVSENYQLGDGSYSATGRSLSSVLSGTYMPAITKTWTSLTSAHNLVVDELTDLPIGGSLVTWGVDWDIIDWNIPESTYSVSEKSKMEIVCEVASAVGGFVNTHQNLEQLLVKSKYPVSPEDLSSTTPDEGIVADNVLTNSWQWEQRPLYNYILAVSTKRIFTSGLWYGHLVHVKRSGTAYDRQAPSVVSDLLTTVLSNRERGRVELDAKGYNAVIYNMSIPLPGNGYHPKLMLPADIVYVEDFYENWYGYIKSLNLVVDPVGVTQNINIERPII